MSDGNKVPKNSLDAAKMQNCYDMYAAKAAPWKLSAEFQAKTGNYYGSVFTANQGAMSLLDDFLSGNYNSVFAASSSPAPSTSSKTSDINEKSKTDDKKEKTPDAMKGDSRYKAPTEEEKAEKERLEKEKAARLEAEQKEKYIAEITEYYDQIMDPKNLDDMCLRKQNLGKIEKIQEYLDKSDIEDFQKSSESYQAYVKYMNNEKVVEYTSVYAPEDPKKVSAPGQSAARKQGGEKYRLTQIENPKEGSELAKLYKQREQYEEVVKAAQEQFGTSPEDYNYVFAHEKELLEEEIRWITSGKREAEIQEKMEQIELYFIEVNKDKPDDKKIILNGDINGFAHPVLKSKQREYNKLYDQLHNLY